ncbi:AraC family transcriptional regulator [Lederbergia panacisoli]|uniref:AraC family transcriptional regulator n=1 Tax=Lederbergia panacisoli TaxID=1255251 RepID=UPI00214CFAD8|nr:AraC family transcriptional regulator [Lederbergia panacisoli]MCR2821666.1 AraC family transcriptional regulator [Lederbergia panacisoli]
MTEHISTQQNELARLIERYSGQDGYYSTAIPSLFFIRVSNVTESKHIVQKPSLCIVVQGVKEVVLAEERFVYGPGNYLVSSVDLPVTGRVAEASSDVPYMCFKIDFSPSEILEVISDSKTHVSSKGKAKRAMFVSEIEISILDAAIRLARLLENPKDIPVLAPLFKKEILYRILQGPFGVSLGQIAIEGSYTYHIGEVIEQIKMNYDKPIRIEELAEIANMSVSSLHRHFKDVTAMSPIQFQKQLRLQDARRILLSESTDAADVAYRVGYESPSQFSREYSRMFGLPPREDIKRLKEKYEQRLNA